MKKIVSLILAILVIVGAVGFSTVSSAFAAGNAEEAEATPLLIVEASAMEVSYMEMTEAIEIPKEETIEVSEEPEVLEVPECTEASECSDEIESLESSESEVTIVMTDNGAHVESVDREAIYFSIEEVFFQVREIDPEAKTAIVQYCGEYYFVVEWNLLPSNGFVKMTREAFADEEFFFCSGDELRAMIVRSFDAGEPMFEA